MKAELEGSTNRKSVETLSVSGTGAESKGENRDSLLLGPIPTSTYSSDAPLPQKQDGKNK